MNNKAYFKPDFIKPVKWEQHIEDRYSSDPAIYVMYLQDDLDITNRCGKQTILMKMEPGATIDTAVAHEFYEYVVITNGCLLWKTSDNSYEPFSTGSRIERAPGIYHGPFKADPKLGCTMYVECYFK
jgi:hypothetical protein